MTASTEIHSYQIYPTAGFSERFAWVFSKAACRQSLRVLWCVQRNKIILKVPFFMLSSAKGVWGFTKESRESLIVQNYSRNVFTQMNWKRFTHLCWLRLRLGCWCSFNIHFNFAPGPSLQLIQISDVWGAGCRSSTLSQVLFGAYFCIVDIIILRVTSICCYLYTLPDIFSCSNWVPLVN